MQTKRFGSWKDMVLTPLVELLLVGGSAIFASSLASVLNAGVIAHFLLWYVILCVLTLLLLAQLRAKCMLRAGTYTAERNSTEWYLWNLHSFLLSVNLFPFYHRVAIPPPFRKFFYKLLGADIARGIVLICGKLIEPHFITLEEGVLVGEDSLLLGHAYLSLNGTDMVVFGKIHVKKNATIGAMAILMPGVTVGEGAMVPAGAVVPMNTTVAPYQVWDQRSFQGEKTLTRADLQIQNVAKLDSLPEQLHPHRT